MPRRTHAPLWRSLGRLLRLSLAPSALSDALLGAYLGAGALLAEASAVAMGASLSVYLGGLALNDVADREVDRRAGRDRPLVRGELSPKLALGIALALLLFGPVLAATLGAIPAAAYLAVATIAVLYDLVGRGPELGPLLLALARGGNVLAAALVGASASGSTPRSALLAALAVATAYGAYVWTVSKLGRMEDDLEREPGARPRPWLLAAAALLLLGPLVALYGGSAVGPAGLACAAVGLVVSGSGAAGLWREALARPRWSHGEVVRAMGLCLRRLMVFTGAAALFAAGARGQPAEGLLLAALVLLGYPISARLRRVFPPS